MAALKKAGVPSNIYYPIPLHLQPAYASFGSKAGDYPISEHAAAHILSLPMHAELTDEDVEFIASQVIDVTQTAAK
jgi:dTDP-4-amino-4,6-dideoxygalactose transaminase